MIQGISEASQSISFDAMADRQKALAQIVLNDPAVEIYLLLLGLMAPIHTQ